MRRRTFLAAAAALAVTPGRAEVAPFPSRPVRLVVPFPPGGNADLVARVVAERLTPRLIQPVLVENRSGASARLGAEAVARASADGHTLLVSNNVSLATAPVIAPPPGYRPLEDFAHLFMICTFANALVVHAEHPAKSLADLVAMARARPGTLRYGSAALGSAGHLTGELFRKRAAIDFVHVPYRGAAPAMADLLGGQIDALFDGLPTVMQQLVAGRVRVLAVTSARRNPRLPDVPTLDEVSPGTVGIGWFGVSAPARTPPEALARIEQDGLHCVNLPEMRAKLGELGFDPHPLGAADYTRFIAAEIRKWTPIVAATGIKID